MHQGKHLFTWGVAYKDVVGRCSILIDVNESNQHESYFTFYTKKLLRATNIEADFKDLNMKTN